MAIKYSFTGKIWQHQTSGGWFFVSLPNRFAIEIRTHLKWQEEGWGRLKATAKINNTQWQTAIWFDTKLETYLLPLKAAIRKKEQLEKDQKISIELFI